MNQKRVIPNPASTLLASAVVGGAGLRLPPEACTPPEGMAAVLLFVPLNKMVGLSVPQIQEDLGLPWCLGEGEPYWFDESQA